MRHVIIFKRTADLARLDLSEQPVASFYVSSDGIVKVEFGEDQIPRDISVFDENADPITQLTLTEDPLSWADLLPSAYRAGDYRVAVARVASADAEDELSTSGVTAELEAVPEVYA